MIVPLLVSPSVLMQGLLSPLCSSHPCIWISVCVVIHCNHHEVVTLPLSLCSRPQTQFYLFPLVVFRSRLCPPSPLCTPVLPPPQPLSPEPARLTSPAGAHRVPTGLPPGWHHASVCLTHATPLGYCPPAATHHIELRVLIYHWLSMLYVFFLNVLCLHLSMFFYSTRWQILYNYSIWYMNIFLLLLGTKKAFLYIVLILSNLIM